MNHEEHKGYGIEIGREVHFFTISINVHLRVLCVLRGSMLLCAYAFA